MHQSIGRARDFIFKKYGPWPMVTLAISVGAFLGSLFFGNWVAEKAVGVWRNIQWFLELPIRFFGFALFGVLLTLILAAFLDTSPSVAAIKEWWTRRQGAKGKRRRPLSAEQVVLVQEIRTAWDRFGLLAVGNLSSLFRDVVFLLRRERYWAYLLDGLQQELSMSREAMVSVLADDTGSTIEEVRAQFNVLYGVYLRVCSILARIEEARDIGESHQEEYQRSLERWRSAHRAFREKLHDLVTIPEHRGTLSIFVNHPEFPLSSFLNAAEAPPVVGVALRMAGTGEVRQPEPPPIPDSPKPSS